ncbi:MAG TPA: hypothetical protein VEW68_00765 [Patescibacteria group bacterium]|nr:hypothetical protein [Patescibacteria group bacterium]
MKNIRLSLIVVGAVGAFLIAMVGASAHTGGLNLLSLVGVHQTQTDEASGARTEPSEQPEPSERPEASPTARPSSKPDTEPDEDDQPKASPSASPCSSDESGGDELDSCGSSRSGHDD